MNCFRISYIVSILSVIVISSCSTSKSTFIDSPTSNFDIKVNPALVELDNLSRLYIVDQKNNIINYKPDLKEMYRYANKRSGKVTSLDVTNPLRIVAFSDDFNQVRILDNTLTEITQLNLSDKFVDISACASSNDGNLWIFDPVQFKLMKIDSGGNIILETSNVNDFGMADVKIKDIRERGNYVVLCDPSKGFYFFDNLGQYIYHYEVKDIKSFQFDGRNVTYYTPTGLKNYSIKFKERQMLAFPLTMQKEGLKFIVYNNGDLYEVNENGINMVKKDTK